MIGIGVIDANMVELGDGQVLAFPPFASAVVGIPHPTVIAGKDRLRIGWINPDAMDIAMHPAETPDRRKAFPCILANNHRTIGLEDAIRVLRVDDQIREIKWAPDHPLALVPLVPRGT